MVFLIAPYLTSVGKFEFDFKIKARRYDDAMI